MQEVYARLVFNEPCLGNDRYDDPEPNKMPRSPSGAVTFHPSWWSLAMARAASILSAHKAAAPAIKFHPEVDGTVTLYKRYYRPQSACHCMFKMHEAFNRGATVGIRAVLPDQLSIDDFRSLLSVVGAYIGISPFGWRNGYGRFSVKEIGLVRSRDTGSRELDAGAGRPKPTPSSD